MAESETTEASTTETTEAPASFVNAENGSFSEGWMNAYVPEDMRDLGTWKSVTDIASLAKLAGNQARLIGKQGKGIFVPGEDSTPTEREAFYAALGRPKSAKEYAVSVPKEIEQYYEPAVLSAATEKLHEAGLTQKQVDAVLAMDFERVTTSLAKNEESQAAQRQSAEAELRKEWGAAYDVKLQLAQRMFKDNAPPEMAEMLNGRIGNDPAVLKFMATIASKFMEGKEANADGINNGLLTPKESAGKMEEMIGERAQIGGRYKNPAKFDRLTKEIQRLSEMATQG